MSDRASEIAAYVAWSVFAVSMYFWNVGLS